MRHARLIAEVKKTSPAEWSLGTVQSSAVADWRKDFLATLVRFGVCIANTDARGFSAFSAMVKSLNIPVANHYGDLPQLANSVDVFNTTPYPNDEAILFHNEASHMATSPAYIFFFCETAAGCGGETPISNGHLAFGMLPNALKVALLEKGLTYYRRFIPGLDRSWQSYFASDDIEHVRQRCNADGIELSILASDIVETRFSTHAVHHHVPGGIAFFHQIALFHPYFLAPEVRDYFEHDIGVSPRFVTFGDGSEIPDEWADMIHAAQVQASCSFRWQEGMLVGVDNRRMAHARAPYRGLRKHFVMLSRFDTPATDVRQLMDLTNLECTEGNHG